MSGLWVMFRHGASIGAWVVGFALVLVVALPVFGMLFALMARVLRGGGNPSGLRPPPNPTGSSREGKGGDP